MTCLFQSVDDAPRHPPPSNRFFSAETRVPQRGGPRKRSLCIELIAKQWVEAPLGQARALLSLHGLRKHGETMNARRAFIALSVSLLTVAALPALAADPP